MRLGRDIETCHETDHAILREPYIAISMVIMIYAYTSLNRFVNYIQQVWNADV